MNKKTVYSQIFTDFDYNTLESEDSIFHYTSTSKALEYILQNDELMLGTFQNTNDPLEYHNKIVEIEYEKEHKYLIKNLVNLQDDLNRTILNKAFFLSACENKLINSSIIERGFDKARMWSQYGDNQKGICLILSKQKIKEEISLNYVNEYRSYFESVVYNASSERFEKSRVIKSTDKVNTTHAQYINRFINKHYKELFFTKLVDYKDENEFRIVIISNRGNDKIVLSTKKVIKGIIFGDNFNKVYLPSFKQFFNSSDIPYYNLDWSSGAYMIKKTKSF